MMTHTKGPWRISGAAKGRGYSISAKHGLVALVKDDTHPLADVTEGQAQANARLVAAAPELFETLKRCEEFLRLNGEEREAALCRLTLAKVTGGE